MGQPRARHYRCASVHLRRMHQCGNGHSRSFSLAICQSRASPCGSTIRKKMISAAEDHQLEIRHQCPAADAGRARCSSSAAIVFRKIGSSTMNAAPRNDPRMLPTPPMMTMNRMRNDRSRLKRLRLDGAEVRERVERAGDAAVERADRERQQLGAHRAGCRSPRPRRPCRAPPSTRGRSSCAPCSSPRARARRRSTASAGTSRPACRTRSRGSRICCAVMTPDEL